MKKSFPLAWRRFLAVAVILTTCALSALPPSAMTASMTQAETLGSASRPVLSIDLTRLFAAPARDNGGRVLLPGGSAVGVALRTDGVLIVGLGEGAGMRAGLRQGDILKTVNGVPLSSADTLTQAVTAANGQPLTLLFERDGRERELSVTPAFDETAKAYRIGVWVRDSTAGVGTLTYIDPEKGVYGALGHAITDSDTGSILPVGTGELFSASVVDVRRGERGAPGELRGSFLREKRYLGSVLRNTPYGIYGEMREEAASLYPNGLPCAARDEVHPGAATILSTVDTGHAQEYAIEITEVVRQSSAQQKSLVLRVTDERLLEKTGGIVQGMSGSPILQDGKIVGAVTHVCVNP